MKKIVLGSLLTSSLLFSITIDQVASSALEKSHSLKAMNNAIEVANKNIELSGYWKNPILTLGVNDIQFNDPLKRDLEPMQAQYIGVSQTLPINNKLELKKEVSKKDKRVLSLKLEDKKQLLKSKIYELSFNVLLLEEELKLLDNYKNNLESLKTLNHDLYQVGKSNQNEIINIDISLAKLDIRKRSISTKIENLYLKLTELSHISNLKIQDTLVLEKLNSSLNMQEHPSILLKQEQIKRFQALEKFEKANKYSDVKLNMAYFNRDNKYEDYANISISIPLSIYKTEDTKAIRARFNASEAKEQLKDSQRVFSSDFQRLRNNLNSAYINYNKIKQTIIPLRSSIQVNLEHYNTLNSIKPQILIKNLNELISLEIEALKWQKIYFKNYAKIKYYEVEAK